MADQVTSKDALIIDPPQELRFIGPFNRPVTTIMKIANPGAKIFLFKIKTTAPKRYCVRPNFGTLGPGATTTVEITLQPFEYESKEKNRHKFMVQSLECPLEGNYDPNQLWKDVDPSLLGDTKLKCVFEMSETPMNYENNAAAKVEKDKTASPKSGGEEDVEQFSKASVDVSNELRALRDEISDLKKQNINLKEQMMRQRYTQNKPQSDEPYAPMATEKQIPMFFIAIAFAAVIFGLLLGKFLL